MVKTYGEVYLRIKKALRGAGIEAAELEGREIVAAAAGKTVEDFLDNIENQQLYQVLIKVDRLTLQAILLQIQGYSIAEIAAILGMKEDTVYKRLGRLKQKIKKLLG